MNITINGEAFSFENNSQTKITVAHALQHYFKHHDEPTVFAVARNQTFVSQTDYDRTVIQLNDSLDVFSPIQGG